MRHQSAFPLGGLTLLPWALSMFGFWQGKLPNFLNCNAPPPNLPTNFSILKLFRE